MQIVMDGFENKLGGGIRNWLHLNFANNDRYTSYTFL